MKGCEEIRPILGSYRDATGAERAAADEHLAACAGCARAFAAFAEADRLLLAQPAPPLARRLARPLAALLADPQPRRAGGGAVLGRRLAPLAAILFLLAALSVFAWSTSRGQTPVTATPTLTTTLTPTAISARATGAAVAAAFRAAPGLAGLASAAVPTPAPAPAPLVARQNAAGQNAARLAVGRHPAILFAGSPGRATISH